MWVLLNAVALRLRAWGTCQDSGRNAVLQSTDDPTQSPDFMHVENVHVRNHRARGPIPETRNHKLNHKLVGDLYPRTTSRRPPFPTGIDDLCSRVSLRCHFDMTSLSRRARHRLEASSGSARSLARLPARLPALHHRLCRRGRGGT